MASHHGCLARLWQAVPPTPDERRSELWALLDTLLGQGRQSGRLRADLTLTDVYLCVLSLRGLIDDTARQSPEIWRRHLALLLAGCRPAPQPLDHAPADDSLVHTRLAPQAGRD
jgi:hypothetical protein